MAAPMVMKSRLCLETAIPHTRIPKDDMIKDNYEVGSMIGKGNFGKVFEATHKQTGDVWAIKSINKEKAGSAPLTLVEREVAILKRVNHPNIINMNEVIESPKRMYLVMELCRGGELAEVLHDRKMFSEEETRLVVSRVASAILYLHKNDIVHRDLKLENILLAQNPNDPDDKLYVKVTDFGLSVVKGSMMYDKMLQDFCGTPVYMSPEILDNKSYSQQCDIWALGVITYFLICGHAPFYAKEESVLFELIRKAHVKFDEEVWKAVSEACKDCIKGMLNLDPAHRLSASEVCSHFWITGELPDGRQPTNVLEMMKMWKTDLMFESVETSSSGASAERKDSASLTQVVKRYSISKKPEKKAVAMVTSAEEKTIPESYRRLSIDQKSGCVRKLSHPAPSSSPPVSAKTPTHKKTKTVLPTFPTTSTAHSPTLGRKVSVKSAGTSECSYKTVTPTSDTPYKTTTATSGNRSKKNSVV